MAEVIELAGQCGNCELPVTLSGADINTHTNISAYVSASRVLAQLKMVGRHFHFSDGTCLQLFHLGNGEVRAIVDEPGFELQVDPPLPVGHLYQQHRQPHDPPVRNGIGSVWRTPSDRYRARWVSSGGGQGRIDASVSSFAKDKILDHFRNTHHINVTSTALNRGVGGGRVNRLLTESPHTPVAGCTTTISGGHWDGDCRLVLTNSSHPFVAWISIERFNIG
ncbi:unnamed protein product [Vitrella brassicaformis CCMP3155]|uniref:Uncharacterized protein n=1 Tax=Vitrella brassicaformis (strain CCMP3155) TaxID=1169540 RepID=A0A0G4GK71_VITBC|nr:unnamed protein product [Vitrella brassicaformis CCMP3155]|eukprot:CEM30339.1 unnamed protein product [Vitrella brassicaformis CCMP3155]